MSTPARPHVLFERIAASMPTLNHSPNHGRAPWRPEDSEVVRWLMKNPRFIAALMVYLRDRKALVFDPASHRWKGAAHGAANGPRVEDEGVH